MRRRREPIKLENVDILFRNFAGAPDNFNPEGGKRSFNVILTPELGEQLIADGWNVKVLRDKMGEEPDQPHIKVNINLKGKQPPRIVLITHGGKARTTLCDPNRVPEEGEDIGEMLVILDGIDIATADVIFNPYQRTPDSPVTAYLKTLFITAREDELEKKYADVPELEFNAPLQIEAGPADDMLEGDVLEDSWDDN